MSEVFSARCRASDLGASSPRTMWRKVIMAKAMMIDMVCAVKKAASLGKNWKSGSIKWAMAGSPTHPRARLARVIPSWVAEI